MEHWYVLVVTMLAPALRKVLCAWRTTSGLV